MEEDYLTEADHLIMRDEQRLKDKELIKIGITNKQWREICEVLKEAGYVFDEYGDLKKVR